MKGGYSMITSYQRTRSLTYWRSNPFLTRKAMFICNISFFLLKSNHKHNEIKVCHHYDNITQEQINNEWMNAEFLARPICFLCTFIVWLQFYILTKHVNLKMFTISICSWKHFKVLYTVVILLDYVNAKD